jgi:hypothetical protein
MGCEDNIETHFAIKMESASLHPLRMPAQYRTRSIVANAAGDIERSFDESQRFVSPTVTSTTMKELNFVLPVM